MTNLLDTLLAVPTVSGGEKAINDKIYRYIKNYVNESQIDALGNLICVRKALPKKGKKPLKIGFFCAVDAPGRIVTYIEENGLVRTAAIGKTDLKFAAYSKVATADEKYTGILVPENFKAEKDAVSEPLFADFVNFDTFSKSDFRAVKVINCEAVKKSKKLLKFTLDDGTGTDRVILSGIHEYYEPEELIGKTCIAITNLPPRAMMGIDSCGMLISAVHHEEGTEKLHLLMVDPHIPAGAKLY